MELVASHLGVEGNGSEACAVNEIEHGADTGVVTFGDQADVEVQAAAAAALADMGPSST